MIDVEICSPGRDIAAPWDALVTCAQPNVFMNPAALAAAQATGFANIHVLLAWDRGAEPRRLVGLWALQESSIGPLWPTVLAAPPYDYAFLSGPVVDPTFMDAVVPAFFAAIDSSPALPNVVRLKFLDGESAAYQAIARTLAARGSQHLALSQTSRPFVSGEADLKRSGSTRKKLRQDWNRLSALGAVDIVNERQQSSVRDAFEVFLAMEAGSWKGARGTALLSNKHDTAFVRQFVGNLAAQRNGSVALLRVDDRPIAAQVLLYCGTMAYTWKTAFDAEYAKFSPGALLVDKLTDELFATAGVTAIESCSPEGSFMSQIWAGRRTTIEMLVDVGTKRSLSFAMAVMAERGYAQARELRNRLRAISWPHQKKKGIAASP
jgi:Acetyltransferase (GNAT) domain